MCKICEAVSFLNSRSNRLEYMSEYWNTAAFVALVDQCLFDEVASRVYRVNGM